VKARARWAIAALSFLWLAFVYASYFLVQQQRPLDGGNLQATGSTLLDLLTAAVILAVSAGLGGRICRWAGIRLEEMGERLILGCGVGLGALSMAVLGVGLLGWLNRWTIAALLGGAALLSLPDLVALGRACGTRRLDERPARGLRIYLCGTLVLALLVALSPPVDWDGLFYHLTLPRLYLEQGFISPLTDMPHQYFPGLMEMLYTAAMGLKGEGAAKLLHFGYMLLLGGSIYLLSMRHVGPSYGWHAVAAYAATPMVPVLGSWAYNDLALAFYQVTALYALLNWFRGRGRAWLALSAILSGLAMGNKYTAFVCPLTLVAFILLHLGRGRAPWREWARALTLYCGVTLLVAAPWYVRNLAFTGNPVYPFAYGLFGGAGWDEWRAAWYARSGSGLGADFGELLTLPWTLTLGLRDMNFYDGRAGPLYLLALPFVLAWAARLYGRRDGRPAAVGYLLVYALVQYTFWVVGAMSSRSLFQSRLLLPAFAVLCAPVAFLFGELRELDTRALSMRRLIGMTVVLLLAANLCYQFLQTVRIAPLGVLVGEERREAFLQRNLGAHYAAMELVNERVPEEGRVLFLWEPRSYYCRSLAQPDAILERWAWLRHRYDGDLGEIARALGSEGYTHVLLHRAGLEFMRASRIDPLSDEDLDALDAFIATYLDREAMAGEAYGLYLLTAQESAE
jgi:hypothetical protein